MNLGDLTLTPVTTPVVLHSPTAGMYGGHPYRALRRARDLQFPTMKSHSRDYPSLGTCAHRRMSRCKCRSLPTQRLVQAEVLPCLIWKSVYLEFMSV